MTEGTRVTLEALQKAFNSLPERARQNGVSESLALASGVLRAFFGTEWFERHVIPNTRKKGFLTIDESDQERLDLSAIRIIDLAELLYNLQHVAGFDSCIAKMQNGDIEGTYAELDFGRMLFLNLVPFRYVVPQGAKGDDYDIQILYPDGLIVCADAKCKVSTTELSENGVKNVLKNARQQLPKDMPGIIFVKVPPHWMETEDFPKRMREVAREFLRNTGRVVSIKYYVAPMDFQNGFLRMQHAFDEINNPDNDTDKTRDWKLFHAVGMPPDWNGMPPHWQRILFFPDGKSR